MAELFQITLADCIGEVGREIAMRRQVYPRRISDKKMKQAQADRQIAVMEDVLARLKAIKEAT